MSDSGAKERAMTIEPDHDLIFAADCPICGRAGTVVAPDCCAEGHDGACSDRICVDCCSALFVDPDLTDISQVPGSRTA
jgi:hypothetical protein